MTEPANLDVEENARYWELVDAILAADDDAGGQLKALLAQLRELEDDYAEEAAALSALHRR